jgi:hypothetical protein
MIALSWWEQFIVSAAVSLLTLLASKVTAIRKTVWKVTNER